MALNPSVTLADVFTALRTFLLTILPTGFEVIQAQGNNVPMPKGDFVAMTQKDMSRVSTPIETYTDPVTTIGTVNVEAPTRVDIQLDFYGASAAENAAMVQALFRNAYGDVNFPNPAIKPLYAENPVQMPLMDGEQGYTQRWRVDAAIQYNPVIQPAQDFAGSLSVTTVSVERTYAP